MSTERLSPAGPGLLLVALVLGACSADARSPLSPDTDGLVVLLEGSHAADVTGDWMWSRTDQLTIPDWFAAGVLGIQPEGRYTHARCQTSGTMTLFPAGAGFEGVALPDSQECWTRGGQAFLSPGFQIPLTVGDGVVSGNALHFVLSNPTVGPCPFHATVEAASDGRAEVLGGGGRCVLPGHPRSESVVVLDPPPGGTSVALRWEAVRP